MMSKKALMNSVVALAATVKTNERVDNLVGQVAELQAQQEGTQRETQLLAALVAERRGERDVVRVLVGASERAVLRKGVAW